MKSRAVFLDRDGVLVAEPATLSALEILPEVPAALTALHARGFVLVVVTNQAVVARGLMTPDDVDRAHAQLQARLTAAGAPVLAWRFCPHHPDADVAAYRVNCRCRKPRPGLLDDAAAEFDVDVSASFMVGDRMTDIEAGQRAGCKTVLIDTGGPPRARIITPDVEDEDVRPTATAPSLAAAATWILAQ